MVTKTWQSDHEVIPMPLEEVRKKEGGRGGKGGEEEDGQMRRTGRS